MSLIKAPKLVSIKQKRKKERKKRAVEGGWRIFLLTVSVPAPCNKLYINLFEFDNIVY